MRVIKDLLDQISKLESENKDIVKDNASIKLLIKTTRQRLKNIEREIVSSSILATPEMKERHVKMKAKDMIGKIQYEIDYQKKAKEYHPEPQIIVQKEPDIIKNVVKTRDRIIYDSKAPLYIRKKGGGYFLEQGRKAIYSGGAIWTSNNMCAGIVILLLLCVVVALSSHIYYLTAEVGCPPSLYAKPPLEKRYLNCTTY